MEGLAKIGPWGSLESIVIRCDWAVDAISFTYAAVDGSSCKAAPPVDANTR
jgi:hypothetical protein